MTLAAMEIMKIARAPVVACLTCPLCSSLLEEATTISECLHSFCRDCIHMKLSEDDAQSCPICDVYLGVAPLEKLRPDPQLDELRNKLFHMTSKRRTAADGSPSSPRKRKERSLSSLGLLSAPSSSARRRPAPRPQQYYARTSTKDISSSEYESEPYMEDDSDDSSGSGHIRRHDRGSDSGRGNRASTSGSKRHSRSAKGAARRRSGVDVEERKVPKSQTMWFALKPAEDQVLPPLPTPYLRITDGRLPVSLVKKYLATKLKLENETDVELTCRGQPVVSSLPLENVQKIWLTKPQQENSGEAPPPPSVSQFLLTLTYSRKTPTPAEDQPEPNKE